jgi:hypothetical protein
MEKNISWDINNLKKIDLFDKPQLEQIKKKLSYAIQDNKQKIIRLKREIEFQIYPSGEIRVFDMEKKEFLENKAKGINKRDKQTRLN